MHELSITESILKIVQEKAAQAGASHIIRINLVLGDWSGLVDDCIQFYFDILSEGTPAERALLSFQRVPARFHCRSCETEFSPSEYEWHCPECGSLGGELIAGREFRVESIEVE